MDEDEFRDAVMALVKKAGWDDDMQAASVLGELSNRYADRAVADAGRRHRDEA